MKILAQGLTLKEIFLGSFLGSLAYLPNSKLGSVLHDNGNFILEHEVGMKIGCIDLGFEDQPDTVTFTEGNQDISKRGITQDSYESECHHDHESQGHYLVARRTDVLCYRIELQVCPDCCQERAKQFLLPWCSSHHLHSKLMERSYDVVSKLTYNNLCLFSNNFVATSVMVISTALNSKAPKRVIFHLLTNEIN
ncbi:hypothetical protein HID58_013581 [Brassica napus]|uniref:Uncharacterized protein n=1 Tax=Brassica napus TaxID=3708 RepID=A0ABQ8E4D8_BRANA|nr:hypothetical protein HID58_013581 [Brassica napus]